MFLRTTSARSTSDIFFYLKPSHLRKADGPLSCEILGNKPARSTVVKKYHQVSLVKSGVFAKYH